MKTGLVFLLLITFGNIAVEAVVCFSCTSESSNLQCNLNTPKDCPSNCMTTVASVLGSLSITKGCGTDLSCAADPYTNVNLGQLVGKQASCCKTFLCNISGSTACGHNLLLLALSAILSGLFLVR